MQITNIAIAITGIITLTIVNHNLTANPDLEPFDQDFIYIEGINSTLNPLEAAALNDHIFVVNSVIDANTITIDTDGELTTQMEVYVGGATAARVSNIQIKTKKFNPYVDKDMNVYIEKIDFAVQQTANGEITVDYFPSSTEVSMIQGGVASGSIMGTSILETSPYNSALYPLEQFQDLLWHPLYFQTSGEYIQFKLFFNLEQMIDPNISLVGFELEGMTLYAQPVGRLQ